MLPKIVREWSLATAAFCMLAVTTVAKAQGVPQETELVKQIRFQLWDWRQKVQAGKGSLSAFERSEQASGVPDLSERAKLFDEALAKSREDHDKLGEGCIIALRAMMATGPNDFSVRMSLATQALEILKSIGRPETCYSLAIAVSEDMGNAGKYQESLEYASYAGTVSSANSLHWAESCLFRSSALLGLGRLSESEAALGEVVEAGLDEATKARVLLGKARTKSAMGRWAESVKLFEQAMLLMGPQYQWGRAVTQGELGKGYIQLGQPERAVLLLQESVESQKKLGVAAVQIAATQFSLGQAEGLLGRFESALEHLRAAADTFKQENLTLQQASTLNLLARMESTMGRPGEAIRDCQSCLQILAAPERATDGRKLRGDVWHQLAPLYWNAGRFDDSVNAYRMAIAEMFPARDAPPQLLTEVDQALNFWKVGDYSAALKHYETILNLLSQGESEQEMVTWWLDLAGTYQNSGDSEGAVRGLGRAQAISDRHGNSYGQMETQIALAQLKLRQGDKASAIRLGEGVLASARPAGQRLYIAKALKVLVAAGHPDSFQLATEALQLNNDLQKEAFYGGGETAAVGFSIFSSRIASGGAAAALLSNQPGKALEMLELGRGKLMEVARIRNRVASTDPAAQSLLAKLQDLYGRVAREPSLRSEAEAVEAQLARQTRSFMPDVAFRVSDLQKRLTDQMAVVVYAEVGSAVRVFVVDRAKVQCVSLTLTEWSLPEAGWTPTSLSNASEKLWKPVEALVSGKKQLFIVADGTLQSVPWEALGQSPLIVGYEVAYADGLTDLLRPVTKLRGGTLTVGGLDYGDQARWQRLPASGREAAGIAKVWGGRALDGKTAQKAIVMRDMANAGCVHFATHAFAPPQVDTKTPEHGFLKLIPSMKNIAPDAGQAVSDLAKSGLVLSDGQVLNGMEILGLDLSGTRLVVLSACDTRKGRNISGEGIYDLRRAFLGAGAYAVVSTLWSVDDAATSRLMLLFHQRLKAGDSPAKALSLAKRTLIQDGEPVQNWAAFVLHQQGLK